MKFLTIRQPWASLIAVGRKTIETRPFSTKYRGPLAIHAGLAKPTIHTLPGFTDVTGEPVAGDVDPCWLDLRAYPGVPMPLQLGAVVAVCDLVDVVPIVDGWVPTPDTVDCWVTVKEGRAYLRSRRCGASTVMDASRTDQLPFGDFTPGRFAWLLGNVRPIDPVPMKGAQGLRDLPADVEDILAVRWAIGGGA